MFKKLLSIAVLSLFVSVSALAQSGSVTGVVTDATSGDPMPAVTVQIVELSMGTATTIDGEYTIDKVPAGTFTLRASFVGYTPFETQITVGSGELVLDISLTEDVIGLEDVVVTAYGVAREEKSIGYAVQDIEGGDVTMVQDDNIVGALSGKISGVQVIGSAGANLGGSEKIRIRGTNGLSDGQPLFVVDGTPIDNRSFSGFAGGRDYGNLAQDLNLQDIENVSVLKGAAASVLYGNRAANGVILITTKKGTRGSAVQVDFSNSTTFERVFILPEYQNEYGGGYTQSFLTATDPEDGNTYNVLNYAADESWGPRMDGTMYRPWWSWFHDDFTGDGVDDYGTEIPLTANPDNVRNFYETGVAVKNTISINGGGDNAAYRVSISNSQAKGVVPNSALDKTYLNFNGSLSHNDKFTSAITFNYVNTKGDGRPAQGYSPAVGSVAQSFNQWFQRQINMDYLKNYETPDGMASWNIRSATNTRPLYWDSPYFTVYENYANDNRDRVYGNYSFTYNVNANVDIVGKVHLDQYSFVTQDRIASGGLELDDYTIQQRQKREVNYEAIANFKKDIDQISISGFAGGNIRQDRYSSVYQSTEGGLSTPNYFNIAASIDRPSTSSYIEERDVRSLFGNITLGYADLVYLEASARNDWSSTLPKDNNSYLYYALSTSLVFTEFSALKDQDLLSFGKIRASIAQVGDDIAPYSISSVYNIGTAYGSYPAQSVPNVLVNPNILPAINTDYEVGLDLRFLEGRLRMDAAYYISKRKDEILDLTVSGASGYSTAYINAGEFTTTGLETQFGISAVRSQDLNVDFTINWAKSYSVIDKLHPDLKVKEIEDAYFGVSLYAVEGEEWGLAQAEGYYGYNYHENGKPIIVDGHYDLVLNKELGNILPDWTGGFRTDINYKNFTFGAFIDFQKGGQFYSISKMFNNYSGLGIETVGNNTLGNPVRDPVLDSGGNEVLYVALDQAGAGSGGELVSGVDVDGNPVQYLYDAVSHHANMFYNKEEWMFDASYVKLREISVSYNLPQRMLSNVPVRRASVSVSMKNALLLYASTDGVDPSIIQNGTTGFSFWEGGGLPGTRSLGFSVNLSF
ncbi:MAG TPA: SusC/RagA family TonB-linked outer membrane protein [Balneolaceae bacterium]|nr:SusC/RagA family TonB-linked outer membrane protein [Balneolaceae bacterium]|tara:strand:+ start:315034 stop:318291 length:3258 start_codon:yes stop_codon:yes gene_type:complete